MTYDGSGWRYLSLTYYAAHGWDFSPMHELGDAEARKKNAAGWPVSVEELRKCYGCHSTRLEFRGASLDTARTELGVRCESCHGPGRAHVEAARAEASDLAINNPKKWSTESFMALCEQCHNPNSTLDGVISGIPEDPASPATVKYHVHGLQQSRCFRESQGALRCTTCHDPHGPAESDPKFYEARCLGCHQPKRAGQVACPVNPSADCLSCHMPKVPVEKHTKFADHWIRAVSPFVKKQKKSR
jgi:formate-dependent nitrite reductase cytochrome c552 subunit